MSIRRFLALTLSVAAVAALAGCESSSSSAPPPPAGDPVKTSEKSKHKFESPPAIQPVK